MAVTNYTTNMPRWFRWTAGGVVHRALLLKSTYVVDPDHVFVSDITGGAAEISVAGYARQTLTTKTETPDLVSNWVKFDCDDPNFGTLVAGQTVAAMVIYEFGTVDADSPILQYMPLGSIATADLPFPVAMNVNGVHRTRAA